MSAKDFLKYLMIQSHERSIKPFFSGLRITYMALSNQSDFMRFLLYAASHFLRFYKTLRRKPHSLYSISLSAKSSFDRSAFEMSCSWLSPLRDGFSDWEKITAVFHPVVMSPTSQFKNSQRFRLTTERICPRSGTWLNLKLLASLLDIAAWLLYCCWLSHWFWPSYCWWHPWCSDCSYCCCHLWR